MCTLSDTTDLIIIMFHFPFTERWIGQPLPYFRFPGETVITVHVFRTVLAARKELPDWFKVTFCPIFLEFTSRNMQKIILCEVRFNPL